MCGNRNHNGIAAPVFRNEFMFCKLLFNMVGVSSRAVHFINGYNNRNLGCFGMVNSFDSLRHNTVIGSYNQNRNVGYLRTAGTHCRKRFVARGIKEYNLFALIVNLISTNVLGNTACFAACYIGFADSVKQ